MRFAARQTLSVLVACLFALPLLAACGAKLDPGEVNVTLDNFTIKPTPSSVKAGTVTFHVKNLAKGLSHEFVIIQPDLSADKLPTDDDGNVGGDQDCRRIAGH